MARLERRVQKYGVTGFNTESTKRQPKPIVTVGEESMYDCPLNRSKHGSELVLESLCPLRAPSHVHWRH
jgi:hypothetical protein